jgi:cell wall-associated NlpC family hydrolase
MTSSGWRNPGRFKQVSYNELQAGDIIVVSGHVGIVAGGGTIIDASSSNGRVVHRNLGAWWANHFICGWRIFS